MFAQPELTGGLTATASKTPNCTGTGGLDKSTTEHSSITVSAEDQHWEGVGEEEGEGDRVSDGR